MKFNKKKKCMILFGVFCFSLALSFFLIIYIFLIFLHFSKVPIALSFTSSKNVRHSNMDKDTDCNKIFNHFGSLVIFLNLFLQITPLPPERRIKFSLISFMSPEYVHTLYLFKQNICWGNKKASKWNYDKCRWFNFQMSFSVFDNGQFTILRIQHIQ